MGNRKRIAEIKINGAPVTSSWLTYAHNSVINLPIASAISSLGGSWITIELDPLGHWDSHKIKKLKIGPLIDFMRFLYKIDIIDGNELPELEKRFKTFNSDYRCNGETQPKNSYHKFLKQKEKKKGKVRRA